MERNAHKNQNIDFTGFRNGKLTVVKKSCEANQNRWLCHCDCGNDVVMMPSRFTKLKSCGCLNEENRKKLGSRFKTHGMTESILYGVSTAV